MVEAVIPDPAEISPTAGEMTAATPLLQAPRTDAAVPAALPCRSSASTCTQGNVNPHAVMNSHSGMTVPQKPAPTWSQTMMVAPEISSIPVENAITHCEIGRAHV